MATENENGLIGLDGILKGIDNYVEKKIVACVNELAQDLQDANPVDRDPKQPDWGVSSLAWHVGVNEYTRTSSASDEEKSPYGGGVEAVIGMKSAGGRFLSSPRRGKALTALNIRKVSNIVVSNNAPYMARLNDGWSPQAQPRWIEAVIDAWKMKWGLT